MKESSKYESSQVKDMARRVSNILKERNIGLQTFLEPINLLGFDLELNSKFSVEDEEYISRLLQTDIAKKLKGYNKTILAKEQEIAKLQKEIIALKKEVDDVQTQIPVSSENIEELNQFEKIILYKRLVQRFAKIKDCSLRKRLQNDYLNYSDENLCALMDWGISYKKVWNVLKYGSSEKHLSELEKKIFFYRFIELESSGRNRKHFDSIFPEQYRNYTEDNYKRLMKWYYNGIRNITITCVNPSYSDIDEETAIMSMLRNGDGDLIGY